MSIFDDMKAKAEELMGGGIEDVTSGITDITDQAKDILPGSEEGQEEK